MFLLLNTVSLKKYQFINANVKLIELLLIEKKIDMNNNYITPHQLYMQQCTQSLTFALRPSYQQWCELFFRGKFFKQCRTLLSNIILENADNDLRDEANTDNFDTESCLYSKSRRNKAKCDHWANQQTRIIGKM